MRIMPEIPEKQLGEGSKNIESKEVKVRRRKLDEIDRKIERAELDPEGDGLYAMGVLTVFDLLKKSSKFERPRGKEMPTFTNNEIQLLCSYLFFKPEGWEIRPFPLLPKAIQQDVKRYDQTIINAVQKEI